MAGDANYPSVGVLLHGDGADASTTIPDTGPSARTITVNGAAKLSTAQAKFGASSIIFDGSSAYLTVGGTDLATIPGDLTVECFAYFAGTPATPQDLICTNRAGSNTNGWVLRRQANGTVTFEGSTTGSDSFQALGPSTPSVGAWHHLAGVKHGSSLTLFIDGTPGTSATMSAAQFDTGVPVTIGRNPTNSSWYYNGYLDEVRVTKGVALYTSAFTPPAAPFLDYAGQVIGTVTDASGAPAARTVRAYDRAAGTLTGTTTSDATSGAYSINCKNLNEVSLVVLDNATSGTIYNDLIDRVIPA